MGEDIRRRVVASFRNAIDCEQNNNDVEAYRKYLDGVALVAAALQQDAECTWIAGNSNLSDKERRSLLGFAKQSVDRLIFLLDKQEPSNIFQGKTNVTAVSKDNQANIPTSVPQSISENQVEVPVANYSSALLSSFVEEHDENDISPIEHMRKENHRLMTRYAARLQNAATKSQRHNLQLELERRLMENSAIAQQQQEAWEQRRNKTTEWCLQVAEDKFKIKEKIDCGSITEDDFRKQRLFAAALQYEEEHMWLKRLKQDLILSPKNEIIQRDLAANILNDRLHPLGSLMGQMQHAILNKVNPLIRTKQEILSPAKWHANINERQTRPIIPSAVEESSQSVDHSEVAVASNSSSTEEAIATEERKAFLRHFNNIADDIKQDVKLLEILMCALYEPLSSEQASNVLTELLHELYFPPLKPALINLIRLGMREEEDEFAYRMSSEGDSKELPDMDEEVFRGCCHALHRLTAIGSPCQMLDSLAAILKTLATTDDPQMKSIGADDLLPRLATVVTACRTPSLLAEAVYMENFMPVSRALGEAGYCVTVLQSVMTCVQIPTG